MKRNVLSGGLILSILIALACSGCSADKGVTTTTMDPDESWAMVIEPASEVVFSIYYEDIFETGYQAVQADLRYTSETTVYFRRYWDFEQEWKVYVFDEELTGDYEQLQNMTPAVVNEGELYLKDGQWLYVYCGCNASTCGEPAEGWYEASYFGA